MDETEKEKEIAALVNRFRLHEENLRISTGAFAGRYKKFLGSEKTWGLLKSGEWKGHIKIDKILKQLQDFARQLDAAQTYRADEFLANMPFVKLANAQFERLLGAERDRRCLTILAPEGIGKSWWQSSKVSENVEQRFYIRLPHTWREKPFHIAMGVATKIGAPIEKNPARQFTSLCAYIHSLQQPILFLDEGHNGGVAVLKFIKDLIDETPVRFVYSAFPTEYDAVKNSSIGAMAEARQFLRRCIRPVFDDYRLGIEQADVIAYLIGAGFRENGELRQVAEQIAPVLARNQNLSTLVDAVDGAREHAEDEGRDMTLADVKAEVDSLISNFEQRRAAVAAAKDRKK